MKQEGTLPPLGSEVARGMQLLYDRTIEGYVELHGGDRPLSSRDAIRQAELMNERLKEIGGSEFVDGTVGFIPTPDGRIGIRFQPSGE